MSCVIISRNYTYTRCVVNPFLCTFFSHQWTPLYCAAVNGNVEMVRYLHGKGADINFVDNLRGVGGCVYDYTLHAYVYLRMHCENFF